MDIERLNRIEEIHFGVLHLAPPDRESYLAASCGGDDELRREVESLLAFEDKDASFLNSPPEALAAEMFADRKALPELIGSEISHYQIIKLLGTGGMGEVYLAEDAKLRRKVALKLLPPQFSADNERKKRFEKEARAVSALNHPNIITIYEIGEAVNISYMATEFIDGHTLRDLIADKPFAWQETVRIAVQIAGALDSAHLVGIIHRDIKPANIMIRGDGIVKVLDFGLAKLTATNNVDAETRENTAPHRVMGTISYMSPEQALGERIDARTDIFSFGVVVYEMLTGEVPFAGSSDAAIYNATINKDLPSICDLNPDVPTALDDIVKRALAKDREVRYQTFGELRSELKGLLRDSQTDSFDDAFNSRVVSSTDPDRDRPWIVSKERSASGAAARATGIQPGKGLVRRVSAIAFAAVVLVGLGAGVWLYAPALWRQGMPPVATAKIVPFTTFSGTVDQPAFSPDGNQIAFTWNGRDGKNLDIYIKLVGAGSPLRLTTNPGDDISPAWSPDGRYLAFIRRTDSENGIFIVPALGGTERKLGRTEPTVSRATLSWAPDGKSLAVSDRFLPQERFAIVMLSIEDGERRRLTSPPESAADSIPAFSPDGQTVAFARGAGLNSEDIYLSSVRGGEPRRLTEDWQHVHSLAWTPDGREIVFSSNRGGVYSLWRVAASGGVPERVSSTGLNAYSPAISSKGDRLVYSVSLLDSDIWRVDTRTAGRPIPATKLISSSRQDHSPQYSPDGNKVGFVSDRSGSEELWTSESDGANPVQLTFFDGTSVGTPRWSPDSRQIIFDARPSGNADIYVISADGGKPRPLVSDPSHDVMASWSRDGSWVYFCSNRSGDYEIWKSPSAGGDAEQVTQHGGFEAYESPNGELLYYTKSRAPGPIWQVPIRGGEEIPVSDVVNVGYWRYWAVGNDGIYFVSPQESDRPYISLFSFTTRKVSRIAAVERDPLQGLPGLTVSPDGRSILYSQADKNISDIMMVENFR